MTSLGDVLLVEFMYLVFTHTPGERMYLWWGLCTLYVHTRQVRGCTSVEFMYLVFTHMPGERMYLGGGYVPGIYTHAR